MIEARRSVLDESYVLGPTAADQFGYRVAWNRQPFAGGNRASIEQVTLAGDSLFTVDSANNLTRIQRANGNRMWSAPVAGPADSIMGVRRAPRGDRDVLLVITEGDIHVLDTNNGVQLDRQQLQRIASTAPMLIPPLLVYGTLNGTLIWHHYGMATYVGGYTLQGAITVPPQIIGDIVIVVTDRGHVMALDVDARTQIWSAFTRDAIVARPALTPNAVYVTSVDQFIRAYDLGTGLVLWSRLHSGALREPPVAIGDRIYVQTPDQGLVCYEALPFEDFDGNVFWSNDKITGTVIGRHGERLTAWDGGARRLTLFDEKTGDVLDTIPLPKAKALLLSSFDSGDLYAIGDDGAITRAVPRSRAGGGG